MKQDGALCRNDFECPPLFSGHIQRKIYFIIAIQENLRIFLNCFFTDGVVEENSIYSAAFCESAALWRGYLFAFSMLNPLRLTFVRQLPRRGSFLQ